MDERERTYLSRDERRAQLLAVGLRLFSTRPYEQVSIDDIAAEAGVSKGLLYHYFRSKRSLYVAVVQHAAAGLVQALAPDPAKSGVENARHGLRAYLCFVSDHADAFLALTCGGLGADPEVQATLEATREAITDQVLLGAGLAGGPVARLAARAWLGGVEAASIDWLRRREVPIDRLLDLLSASLFVHVLAGARLGGEATPNLLDGLPLLAGLLSEPGGALQP